MHREHFAVGENYVQVITSQLGIGDALGTFLNYLSFHFVVFLHFSSGNGKKRNFKI